MNNPDLNAAPAPVGDYGPELNALLDRIGSFCASRGMSAADFKLIFNAGLGVAAVLRPDLNPTASAGVPK